MKHKIKFFITVLVTLSLVFLPCLPSYSQAYDNKNINKARDKIKASVAEIVDADTIKIWINNRIERLRFIGIDAPEIHKNRKAYYMARKKHKDIEEILKMGKKAKEYLLSVIKPGDIVWVEFDVQLRDKYGRLLGYVYLENGEMLNEKILKDGYAYILTIPPNVKYVDRFYRAYRYALENKKGLWSGRD